MSKSASVREQLRRNTVALISLAVAITSLGYNTWRNALFEVWNADYKQLGEKPEAKDRIIAALELVRHDVHEVLRSLN
tara:strand:- start:160 stop:393 length:234 start_codon:yes stop_codon:yes gene_type:complete